MLTPDATFSSASLAEKSDDSARAMPPVERTKELDGLRGVAALTVVFWHFFCLFPKSQWTLVWKASPLYVLVAGGEAVLLFFVLSGFALSAMYVETRNSGYKSFALRRIIRIYGPYLGALVFAVAADRMLSHGHRSHFSLWFNRTWTVPFCWADVWTHVGFIGIYNYAVFNTAFWSLVHEMRLSLVFPIMYVAVSGRRLSVQIGFACLLVIAGTVCEATIAKQSDVGLTVLYSSLFVLGLCIFERKSALAEWYGKLTPRGRFAVVTVSLVLFYCGRLLSHVLPASISPLTCLPLGLGAAGLTMLAFSSYRLSNILRSRPISWLGRMSYSLYLVHGTILFALVNLLGLQRPRLSLFLLYLPLTLLTAFAFHVYVEKPLIARSRHATAAPNRRSKKSFPNCRP